jgi:glycosyltransferase involved in cell wall biosynthesis
MLFRLALGKNHRVPRVFQVPGPLHVEHALFRNWDLGTAGDLDYWIATNRYTAALYSRAGVLSARVLLSYYGFPVEQFSGCHGGTLRRKLDIGDGSVLVGNISYIYAPKYYLGQTVGLKCHEDLIDALDIVTRERPGVIGVLAGSAWGRAATYEQSLRERAASLGQGRILMPGYLTPDEVKEAWPDFACVVHASLSDACAAGVLEPLLVGVPTIASRVGGLPEVVVDGVTGILVQPRKPRELAQAVLTVLDDLATYRAMALTGRELVRTMFDVRRTASEVLAIYRHILDPSQPRPDEFDSQRFLEARHAVG